MFRITVWGEADPAMRRVLEKHLNECDNCAAELFELRRLRALLKLAFGDESDFVRSKLVTDQESHSS